jgi:hypothetical protein
VAVHEVRWRWTWRSNQPQLELVANRESDQELASGRRKCVAARTLALVVVSTPWSPGRVRGGCIEIPSGPRRDGTAWGVLRRNKTMELDGDGRSRGADFWSSRPPLAQKGAVMVAAAAASFSQLVAEPGWHLALAPHARTWEDQHPSPWT